MRLLTPPEQTDAAKLLETAIAAEPNPIKAAAHLAGQLAEARAERDELITRESARLQKQHEADERSRS